MRFVVLALLVASAWVVILAACDASAPGAASELEPGGTYGAEVSLVISGRGRVTSTPSTIDCPSNCFARVVFDSANVDGGDGGITLVAQETGGSHFVGWSFAEVDLGARGRGPSACSPVLRKASVPAQVDRSTVVTLPFGETRGTPPRGHEAECAAFTSVSVAYAVTATFAEDPPIPGFDAAFDPADLDVLFLPLREPSEAKEIGVTSGYAYWRYEMNGLSGIGGSFLQSAIADEIVAPTGIIRLFDVDRHAVFQYVDNSLWVVQAGTLSATPLAGAPQCSALASDALNVYCRGAAPGGTAIYAWPVTAGVNELPSVVALLPPGNALAVDTQRFYFSDDPGGLSQAKVRSTPRDAGTGGGGDADADAAPSSFTTLAFNQTAPSGFTVGPAFLAWIDDEGGQQSARSTSKLTLAAPITALTATSIRTVTTDPSSGENWIAVGNDGSGAWVIYRNVIGANTPTFFRSGTTDIGGLAVDSEYVYWTRPNGRVYRAFKNVPRK